MESSSLYQDLGVSKDASTDTIRQQYLKQVRSFPPETHPEEFQRIRHAYEVLSDVSQRHAYDNPTPVADSEFSRRVREYLDNGQWKKLLSLVKDAPEPDRSMLRSMAYAYQGRWDSHFRARDRSLKILEGNSDWESLAQYLHRTQFIYVDEFDRMDDAFTLYDRFRANPLLWRRIWPDYGHILGHVGRKEELVRLVDPLLDCDNQPFERDQGELWVTWIAYLSGNLRGHLPRYRARAGAYWRRAPRDEVEAMKETLWGAVDDMLDNQNVEGAHDTAEFLMLLDSNNSHTRERVMELNDLAAVDQELEKMYGDRRLHPAIMQRAEALFTEKMGWDDMGGLIDGAQDIPVAMDYRQQYVEAINRVKKSYPATYQMFRESWQRWIDKLVAGMNREQRRRLIR